MFCPSPSVERAPTRKWLPREALERLDAELVALAQGATSLRLGVGEALLALGRMGGLQGLGFSGLLSYARERCEHSGRWAQDSRALAGRLQELPLMRAALLSGELGWSMVELLSRHAEAQTEQELLSEAKQKTVRQMRQLLRQRREEATEQHDDGAARLGDIDEEPEPLAQLTVTMTAEEAWAFECTKMLVEQLGPAHTESDVIDALLAEGMTTLLPAVPDAVDELEQRLDWAPFADEHRAEQHRQWQQQLASWRDESEQRCEERIPERPAAPAELGELGLAPEELPHCEIELDRIVVRLSKQLLRRDLALGDGLRQLCDANGWRRLGYASFGQYARERLGVSHSSAKAHMTLSRRALGLEPLRQAVDAGAVGFEAAMLVGRVATEGTVQAWLDRAQQRTLKHLAEEVSTAEVLARTSGVGEQPPPSEQTQAAMMKLESHVLSGRVFRNGTEVDRGQMSVAPADDAPLPRRGAGKVTLRWRVSRDVARAWHALKRLHARSGLGGSFVELLCMSMWHSWKHTLDPDVAYGDIYARERYRCSSPVCHSRNQTPHHIRFRSRGGDDSSDNLTAPCACCHLDGIHQGNIRATGPASDLHWQIGRAPILEVQGRLRRQLAGEPNT